MRFTVEEITDLALKAARANSTLSDYLRSAALEHRPATNTALVRHDLSRIAVHLSRQNADKALIDEIRAALETL
ncbi:MAG: hypothetical protein BGO51_10425 [Rhodospirillales bacterium 69-11]|nr:MAG: hypothetical protein BGO51_10425 [Rhodospirillales bacterium 69-11]